MQIFATLSNEEIETLFVSCEFFEYENREKIIEENSMSTFFCGILDGDVNIHATGEEKREIRIGRVHKGDIVGEASIFMDVPRTADVVADGRVEILKITRDKLIAFVNNSAKAGVKIFGFIIFSLIHKLKSINKELVFEKESTVTSADIEQLKKYFAPVADDYSH
jgi:CRP-like cAMP-binding protein